MDDDGETTYETPMFLCFNIKIHLYLCLLVNETKNPQHLDFIDRYLQLMGDKTIPDSAEPRLESFYPPFVAGIDLPHQGVVDSYNLYNGNSYTGLIITMDIPYLERFSLYCNGSQCSHVSEMVSSIIHQVFVVQIGQICGALPNDNIQFTEFPGCWPWCC